MFEKILKNFRCTRVRKISQGLFLILFIVLGVKAASDWNYEVSGLLLHLDPLTTIGTWFATGSIPRHPPVIIAILLTLALGRAWCGWICPLGTVLDVFPLTQKPVFQNKMPSSWLRLKFNLAFFILAAALFGSMTFFVLDPLTIFYRTLFSSIIPAADQVVSASEAWLYPIPMLSNSIATLDSWLRPAIFPAQPLFYRTTALFSLVMLSIILLNALAGRFWCRFLCPLGGLLSLISRLAFWRREAAQPCLQCKACVSSCPVNAIDPAKGFASDPGECTLCFNCFEVCPQNVISLKPGFRFKRWPQHDPQRREFLGAVALSAVSAVLFSRNSLRQTPHPFHLQPPGAEENNLLEKCIRCGLCIRACPTAALQPALSEAGLEGLWTPVLTPRNGYCDYACNACGQICPVEAIPLLTLEEKRTQVIGKAYIDRDHCIAWSGEGNCIVCEEMCPLPKKAIWLETEQVVQNMDTRISVMLPHVDRTLCIGCGICEFKCPVGGDAAIRVYHK